MLFSNYINGEWVSGPTFGYVTDLTQARVARIGAKFSF